MEKTELLRKLATPQFKTQSDSLADRIKNMITTEELEKGFSFPNENEFCKILNVSRGTLRDAYKKLDTQGFIERTKHGTFVKCKDTIAMQGNFSASLELASRLEMMEFICAFEPEAAALAAQKIDADGLDKLKKLMEECEDCAQDQSALNEANYKFHEFIRLQTKNALIISALSAYYDIFSKHILTMIYDLLKHNVDDFTNQALQQHRLLFDAFCQKDTEAARKISYDHLQADLQVYEKLYTGSYKNI